MHVLVCALQHGKLEWDSSAGRVVGYSETGPKSIAF